MNTIIMNTRRKALNRRGFTMAETLIAVVLVGIISMGVAAAVAFAGRQYRAGRMVSEAKVLCSTLTSVIQEELSNTPKIRLADESGTLDSFYSRGYAHEETVMSRFYSVRVDEDMSVTPAGEGAYGQLLLGSEGEGGALVGNLLLSSAAYGTYQLQAKVTVSYDTAQEIFRVSLFIRDPDGRVDRNDFEVIPLNDVIVET